MKKIFCVFFIFLLTLVGCKSKTKNISPVTKNISFNCDITFYNETYECKVVNTKNNNFNLIFTYPESINGLEYIITDKETTCVYKGIKYNPTSKNFPHQNIVSFIYSALSSNNDKVFENDNNFYIKGDNFSMYLGQTGLPLKIVDKNNIYTVIIKNATILKK